MVRKHATDIRGRTTGITQITLHYGYADDEASRWLTERYHVEAHMYNTQVHEAQRPP